MSNNIVTIVVMMLYMLIVVGIGIYFAKRAQASSNNFFLGGRTIGPWVAAMSAEASDMSGWLLMGLPGVAYFYGAADAAWTAIGLALGTYVNWLIVSKRLRKYSTVSGNSITLPEFFSNRFHEKKKVILGISAIFIFIFFSVYAASCFVTCGKLFSTLFGMSYQAMMLAGALFVIIYTFIGGFLAESVSDFMQAIVMIGVLVIMFIVGITNAGGLGTVIENAKAIPGYFSLTSMASPALDGNGIQQIVDGAPAFGDASKYGFLTIISTMSWGLGYFGMPQVLLRFMAIRKTSELSRSRRVAIIWCVISLFAAVMIGIIGKTLVPTNGALLSASGAENVFIIVANQYLPVIVSSIAMAGILAATISSSDSYLLIATSSVSVNIFKGIFKKNATDKEVMLVTRIILVILTIIAIIIAWDENSVIFTVVSFAWAGFGATFGPIMLMSLFWKRTNIAGAIAGMLSGGIMVFVWKLLLKPMGGIFGIYELFPAFIISVIAIVVVSLATAAPSNEVQAEFDRVKSMADDDPALNA